MGEAGRALDPGCVESLRDALPRTDVRAVSGRLVTDLSDHPPPGLPAEAHLSGTENGAAAGAHHVLASTRREPQDTRQVDDERERLGQLHRRQRRSPVVEVRCREDASALSLRPDKGPQIRRSHIPIAPSRQVHAGQHNPRPTPGPGEVDRPGQLLGRPAVGLRPLRPPVSSKPRAGKPSRRAAARPRAPRPWAGRSQTDAGLRPAASRTVRSRSRPCRQESKSSCRQAQVRRARPLRHCSWYFASLGDLRDTLVRGISPTRSPSGGRR